MAERHEFAIKSETEAPFFSEIVERPEHRKQGESARSQAMIRTFRPATSVVTDPTVTSQSMLRWKAQRFNLVLENPADFDMQYFSSLVDAFERSVVGKKNASVIFKLHQWAERVRTSALPSATVNSLLRWVTTNSFKTAVPCAEAIWHYLFGKPVPTWYVWNQSKRSYEFDAAGWQRWAASLSTEAMPVQIDTAPVPASHV